MFVRWRHQFHVDCWWSPCWRLWSFALLRQASWRRAASEDWAARPEHGHSLSPRIGREEILGNPHFEVGTITGLVVWNIWNMFFHSVGNFMIPTYPNWLSLHHLFSPYYIYILHIYITYIYTLGISSSQLTFTPSFFRGVGRKPTRPSPGRGLDRSDGQGARDPVAVPGLLASPAFAKPMNGGKTMP